MAGGDETIITQWQEVVQRCVPDRCQRSDLVGISQIFAELAGCGLAWQRGLEGFEMTESQVVNG